MKNAKSLYLLLVIIAICNGVLGRATAQEAKPADGNASGTSIDLSKWKLTLPVDAKGSRDGKPQEVGPKELVAGFQSEYFKVDDRGVVRFWCPVDGVTTKGTDYPRSELREMLAPDDSSINWRFGGTHVMKARCRIVQLPSSPKVVIGQIHGYSGTARPLIKLQYNKDRVEALVKISPNSGKDQKLTFAGMTTKEDLVYEIKLDEGTLFVTVNGSTQSVDVLANDRGWADETFYFKAGVYPQSNEGNSTDGARVEFYELSVMHSDSNG